MSDDRTINVTNCTIYVGRVQIVLEPSPKVDEVADGVIEASRSAEDPQDDSVTNAPKKQTDFVSDCSTSIFYYIIILIISSVQIYVE